MRPHTFGLIAAAIVAIVFVGLPSLHHRNRAVGFEVLLLKEGPKAQETDHWGNVLVVRIDAQNKWFLNSQQLSRTDLRTALREKLCWRAEKVLLFDGHPDIAFGEAAEAIDSVESVCPTAVALVTPGTKKVDPDSLYPPEPRKQLALPR
jgi:biopolymer transport protein ExbD